MTFKPEIGKRHVMRNGEITDVVKRDDHSGMFYTGESFLTRNMHWYSTGVALIYDKYKTDLVAVYEEPQYYWINVYPDCGHVIHKTKQLAKSSLDECSGGKTLKLKVVEGDE